MFDKVLIAVDGSPISSYGAEVGVEAARKFGAEVHVLFVKDTHPGIGVGPRDGAGIQALMAATHDEGLEALNAACAMATRAGLGASSSKVEGPDTAEAIVETARSVGANLIVLASHGRSGIQKLVLGSVAAKVLVLSTVPVLVVKREQRG